MYKVDFVAQKLSGHEKELAEDIEIILNQRAAGGYTYVEIVDVAGHMLLITEKRSYALFGVE